MWNLKKKKKDNNELIYKAEKETQMQKRKNGYQGKKWGRDKLGDWD